MIRITQKTWDAIPTDYKTTWTNPEYPDYIGKRTVFEGCVTDHASTALFIEGLHFEISDAPTPITAIYAGIDEWGRAVFQAGKEFYCIVDKLFRSAPTPDQLAGLPIYTKGRRFEGEPAWTVTGVELKVA